MSGYVASARIVRASPRIVDHRRLELEVDRPPAEPVAVILDRDRVLAEAGPFAITLAERWGRVRDRWDQLTFFVTNPESWR